MSEEKPTKPGVLRLIPKAPPPEDGAPPPPAQGSVGDIVNRIDTNQHDMDTIFVIFRKKDGDWGSAWSRTTNGDLVYALKVFNIVVDDEVVHGLHKHHVE